ncbi:MAG: S9 family peptidase [Lentimicrobiaceae bacterium]|jgi:dipeptidyl-peptidase-4|nr:S9 family peptidase [Lentimicrobiaceae bacterium]MBT3455111.1 S9 family peptidase [Lentimicrobiaceae bacterium]MBT3818710.1 S9 family peptidase [Lentimicrobiaceae bacterium]MBT4062292.1 S9 family peptidase [Lentimicrobiaceae bacterium]MBT4189573.1 S9 family peptidase [Lentimicrobiaceae bacterium]
MKNLNIILVILFAIFSEAIIAQDTLKEVNLKEIWTEYKFMSRSVRGINSLKNGKDYTVIKKGSLIVYDYKSGDSITTLITPDNLIPEGSDQPIRLRSFSMSNDETRFLIPTSTESIYRHSTKSDYYVFDINSKKLTRLSENGKQSLADFSPDGTKVAFVRDNDIYIVDLNTGNEKQITTDGKRNHIINGTCDWVYEEEFSFTKAFFWSPDGSRIAFYKFDESDVKEYTIEYYGNLYPKWETYKYPKAGEDNSVVGIYVYALDNGYISTMPLGENTDIYIPRIKWTKNPEILSIQRLNRLQNHLEILIADSRNGDSYVMYSEKNEFYIDITDNLTFLENKQQFLITSEQDGYNHIYLYNMDGSMEKQLTSGKWDVTNIYGWNPKSKIVYYQSAELSPLDRDIYKVNLKGIRTKISQEEGTNDADFSNNFKFYISNFSTIGVPPIYTVNDNKGKVLRVLEDNKRLKERLAKYEISKPEFFTFSTPEITLPDGKQVELNGFKILPYNFNPDKEYPVLVTIYGGPGSQTTTNSWGGFNYMWYQMLAENGIMVVTVDNRGTGARGEVFKKMTYLELGKYETLDYIETAKYLGNLTYVDKNKIAIFGWSYGGFMASNALFQGAEYYSTAIAVAPVTNWRYYDNIYTERFMRKPQDNPDGYDNNSPINHVDKLKGNYLLIHGDADDNVHPQNSMDLFTALVKADKQFDFMLYPNKNHSIYGGNTRYHLYTKMTNFLYEHLLD